ncbi:NUDIX hydrolase domain-like protein [Aspergillus carlsbadensis]|nr:NUDIX hydrolase domain-like protein [Aspergillus carlsbadensis]
MAGYHIMDGSGSRLPDLEATQQPAISSLSSRNMATSHFPTAQFSSEHFVESCGAILLDISRETKRVCLIQYQNVGWFLPKGRRNIGETRHAAALREVEEETGYKCRVYPVSMSTRAPRPDDPEDVPDTARLISDSSEPFMLTVRELDGGTDVKIIWWYIAVVDDNSASAPSKPKDFTADFFTFEEALQRLVFQSDRDILSKALMILERNSKIVHT